MKYKEWLKIWLDNYIKLSLKYRTYINYSDCVNKHITPILGEYELCELKPYVIQQFITQLSKCGNLKTGKELAASSINKIITVVQNSIEVACVTGEVKDYSFQVLKRPKIIERQIECFSISEQKKIENAILNLEFRRKRMFGVILCLYTGIRLGELLALEWSDIDLVNGSISITKTCYYGKNKDGIYGRIVDKPKTKSSIRTIPIPKQIIPLLKVEQKKSKSNFVVSNGSNPVSIRSYQESFTNLLKNINVEQKGFHILRHTFATRAIECGMDVKTLSEILGHKNSSITLNCYVHSLMEHKKEMMNKVGKLL